MRMSSFQDGMAVLKYYGIDPAVGAAIDVGGTREVYLKQGQGSQVSQNPLLQVHPKIMFLDRGFNVELIGTDTDLCIDFLDPKVLVPWRDHFDLVFSFDTLEHIRNPFLFCQHLEAITRPGGYIYVSTLFQYVYHPSPEDFFRFSPAGLRQCFVDASNPARDRLSVVWCGWESDGDGVALLAVKGPAPKRPPLRLPRAGQPETALGVQARGLARSVLRRARGQSRAIAADVVDCPLGCGRSVPAGRIVGGYPLWACPSCGLRFAPGAFGAAVDYESVYDSKEYWEAQVRPLCQGEDPLALVCHSTYAPFFKRVPATTGARLLDVGCGVGRFGRAAHARGFDVTGIDLSAKAIAIGQPFAPFPLRQSRLEDLGEVGEFDVVTAFEVLEHLADPVATLRSMLSVLRPGGQLFVTVPNWNCKEVQNSERPEWLPPIHILFFTVSALARAGVLSGLTEVVTGEIQTDPFPVGSRSKARWLQRRLQGQPRSSLGLWLHGRKAGLDRRS